MKRQFDQSLHCCSVRHSVCGFLMYYCMTKSHCSNCRIITAILLGAHFDFIVSLHEKLSQKLDQTELEFNVNPKAF